MDDPILDFRAVTAVPMGFRKDGTGFFMGGQFSVHILFDKIVDCSRYEYRQYIKGSASVTQGIFAGGVASWATWSANGSARDASGLFAVPGGLSTSFKEDGLVQSDGKTVRFGYRSSNAMYSTGLEDHYEPKQATGHKYKAVDTYGLRSTKRPSGLRVTVSLIYKGAIIDTKHNNRVLRTLHWRFDGDDIIP